MRISRALEDKRKDVAIESAVRAAWKAEWVKAVGIWLAGVGVAAGLVLVFTGITGLGRLVFGGRWLGTFACYSITFDLMILAGIILWGAAKAVRSTAEQAVDNLLKGERPPAEGG